jgi:hypothetical protein
MGDVVVLVLHVNTVEEVDKDSDTPYILENK